MKIYSGVVSIMIVTHGCTNKVTNKPKGLNIEPGALVKDDSKNSEKESKINPTICVA